MNGCQFYGISLPLSVVVLYVGSLYLWPSGKARDDPSYIKPRILSVIFTAIVSVVLVYLLDSQRFWALFEFELSWIFVWKTLVAPLLLTALLFLGPILLWCHVTIFARGGLCSKPFVKRPMLVFLRNYIICPTTEEIVYRGALFYYMVPCFSKFWSYLADPDISLAQTILQVSYTFVFACYSASLYVKTSCIYTCIVTHIFCNCMGFPDFESLLSSRFYSVATVTGLFSWMLLFIYYCFL